jgi:DNA-binding CsgD family transcriptional regulator
VDNTLRTSGTSPSLVQWPLVGRDDELGWAAASRREDATYGVVLGGSAGVGKTRLAREVLSAACAEGISTEWVQATVGAASIPLGAFAALVPPATQTGDPLQLFHRCAEALRERGAANRVVLGVDDAHLLDPTSAALVLHLATSGIAFAVVTVRSTVPCPDSIVALWKDHDVPRLEIQHLSEAETERLLAAVLDAEVDPDVRRWAYKASEGHVLYLRELVAGALASGALVSDGGTWRLQSDPGASPALIELISQSLDGLRPEELHAARLLAFGEPLELDLLVGMVGLEPLAALEEREIAQVVRSTTASAERSEVRLGHPLYGEVLRAGTPTLRGRQLRLRLADAVRTRGFARSGAALRVATWLDEGGAEIDHELLLAAARDALSAGDAILAERLAYRASPGAERSLALAAAYVQERRFEEAEELLAECEPRSMRRELALEYAERRALRVLHFGLVRSEEALALLAATAPLFDDTDWIDRLEMMRLQVFIGGAGGGPQEAVRGLERLLQRDDQTPEMRRQTSIAYAIALWQAGRTEEALSASAAMRPTLPLRDASDANALAVWCYTRAGSGNEWPEVERWLGEAYRDSGRANLVTRGEVATLLAESALDRGKATTAVRLAREAIEILENFDTVRRLPLAMLTLGTSSAHAGDTETARQALVAYESAIGEVPRPYWRLRREEVTALAALAVAEGDSTRAIALLLEAASANELAFERARLLYEALRAGAAPSSVASELEQAARESEAPLSNLFAAQAAGQASRDGHSLVTIAAAFGEIGAWLWAAESAALAALAFDDAGREDSARRAMTLSSRFLEKCENVSSPVLAAVALAPVELTAREQEIVALAARGASNAEIAERLVLSVRTVESHLYRAMQKLGISSRQDLDLA